MVYFGLIPNLATLELLGAELPLDSMYSCSFSLISISFLV